MQTESTHAALVIAAPGQMLLEQVATKRPRAGEIRVAPLRVGICGSDLDVLRGSRPFGARILGHEGVAEVVAVGAGLSQYAVGQRVTFLPNNPNDPADVLGVSTEGLYQQSLVVPSAALDRGMVVRCDAGIPLDCGPLIEPFATVLYGQRLAQQVCAPQAALIVGAGPIGLLNVLYARAQGCAQIFLVAASQSQLDWAVKRGIVAGDEALLNSPQLVDVLLQRTAGQGVDAAYLCTPRSATRAVLQQALRLAREEGVISLTAGTDSSEELPELPGVDLNGIRSANVCGLGHEVKACATRQGKRLWLTGHSGASASYLQESMRLLREDAASYARVISHLAPYRTAPRMFGRLLAADPQSIERAPRGKVIIDFTNDGDEITAFDPQ